MTSFWVIGGLLLLFSVCTHLASGVRAYKKGRDDGFRAGHRKGFELGWKDGDNWWIGVEEATQESREELWREELGTNREKEK